jgi:hypothetical protein
VDCTNIHGARNSDQCLSFCEHGNGSEVLTEMIRKSTIFWDVIRCSSVQVNRRLGGTYRLHLQGRRVSREWNQQKKALWLLPTFCWLLPILTFDREDGGDTFLRRQVEHLLIAGFLLGLLFDPEDGVGTFFRNVNGLSPNYTVLHPSKSCCSTLEFLKAGHFLSNLATIRFSTMTLLRGVS